MHPRSHVRRCRSRSSFRHILQLFVALFTILQCLFQAVEAQHAIGEGFTRMVEYSQVISPPRSTPVWPVSGEVVAQQASESRESIDATASIVSGTVTQLGSSEAIVPTEPSSTEWTRFDKVVVAHAVVGSIAWMIISPVAIIIGQASSSSFRACTTAQNIVTSCLTVIAVVLGCIATKIGPSTSHFESSHQQLGLSLMLLLLLQLLMGRFFASNRSIDVRILRSSDKIHTIISVILSALGFAQIWLGMQLYEDKSGRRIPLAAKVIWAIIVTSFSILLIIFTIKKQVRPSSKPSPSSMKGIPPLHRRKATTADVSNKHHHERGIRSDGLWINVLGENGSGSTFVSSYTDTTVFSEASKDPGLLLLSDRKIVLQQLFSPPPPIVDSLTISSMWLNDLESDMPLDPSTLPVYQVNQSYSNRAPISNGIELSLPSTNVSPLVPIIEEDTEEEEEEQEKEENVIEDWDEQRTDVESIGQTTRPISWSATSVDTARSSSNNQAQSQSSKSKSIKRKPVPKS